VCSPGSTRRIPDENNDGRHLLRTPERLLNYKDTLPNDKPLAIQSPSCIGCSLMPPFATVSVGGTGKAGTVELRSTRQITNLSYTACMTDYRENVETPGAGRKPGGRAEALPHRVILTFRRVASGDGQ
jgi:hypothetical protein